MDFQTFISSYGLASSREALFTIFLFVYVVGVLVYALGLIFSHPLYEKVKEGPYFAGGHALCPRGPFNPVIPDFGGADILPSPHLFGRQL